MSGKSTFYTGYVRVPDKEVAICQVWGTLSKIVPVCPMHGCQVIILAMCGYLDTEVAICQGDLE